MGISCFSLYAPAVEMFNACSYMHIYICILNCVFYTSSKLVYDVHVKKMSHMSSTILMKDRNKKNSERSAKQKDNQEKNI